MMVQSASIRKPWLRSSAFGLTAYLVIAYFTIGAFLYFSQDTLLFPAPTTFERTNPAQCGIGYENLRISVSAKDAIHAWWVPSATPSEKVILVFHGNGYVLEDMVSDEVTHLHGTGANLLLIDYRGCRNRGGLLEQYRRDLICKEDSRFRRVSQ